MRPLVRCLGLAHTCETHAHLRRNPDEEQALLLSSSSEEEAAWIRDAWTDFDQRHLQPYFGHGGDGREETAHAPRDGQQNEPQQQKQLPRD
jgi:hypothetical protein